MDQNEIRKFIEENLEIKLYSRHSYGSDSLTIKAVLQWKGDVHQNISEDRIYLRVKSDGTLSHF